MNFNQTVKGSLLEGFYPAGWDMEKIDRCCANAPETIGDRQSFWNEAFQPVACAEVQELDVKMGHEIATEIRRAKEAGRKIAFILPVGPMGMYKWAVYFLKEWNVDCSHVYGFNMDEWSDGEGNTLPSDNPGSFQNAMEQAFYGPLGELTVPTAQRHFATKATLPTYAEKIAALKAEGAELITVFGIGRMMHIAFWEPHFGAEFASDEEWSKQTHRIGAQLHPLTIEQNAITSFKSRTTLVPCRANTVGQVYSCNRTASSAAATARLAAACSGRDCRYGRRFGTGRTDGCRRRICRLYLANCFICRLWRDLWKRT